MELLKGVYWYRERCWFSCNTYLISDDRLVVLIDPGPKLCLNNLLRGLEEDGLSVRDVNLIINTHSHPDHAGGSEALKELSGARVAMHKLEAEFSAVAYTDILRALGLGDALEIVGGPATPDEYLEGVLRTGRMEFAILHTPGHTPGSICLYEKRRGILISGDTILGGGVGRFDLPGGDLASLRKSVEGLSKLRVEYLLPGHYDVLIGAEDVAKGFRLALRTLGLF